MPESKRAPRVNDSWSPGRQGGDSGAGSPDKVPPHAAASDPHHGLLVPVALLRRLHPQELLPQFQHALFGTVVGMVDDSWFFFSCTAMNYKLAHFMIYELTS